MQIPLNEQRALIMESFMCIDISILLSMSMPFVISNRPMVIGFINGIFLNKTCENILLINTSFIKENSITNPPTSTHVFIAFSNDDLSMSLKLFLCFKFSSFILGTGDFLLGIKNEINILDR